MGKGDKKTKRGKIILGSSGVRRLRRPKTQAPIAAITKKVENVKPEKLKPIKQPEKIAEDIAVAAKAVDQPVVAEKKIIKPKTSKKPTTKTDKAKDIKEE